MNLKKNLSEINLKLYKALLLMGLCPAVYTTVRTFLIGQIPGDWAYSIAGQLSWVNLLYEIAGEAVILPLFFFMGEAVGNRKEFVNRLKTGLSFTAVLYTLFAVLMMIFAVPLLRLMAASPDLIGDSAAYIRIESVAYIFSTLYGFVLVALITTNRSGSVYILTGCKMIVTVLSDLIFVSQMPVSLKLGVNGIGISNLIVNFLLFIAGILLLKKYGYDLFEKTGVSNRWMKHFLRVGSISGLESLVRNLAYMLMIVRMVNAVNEQGTYWVANNFIWGWLLLPISQLAELIKQEAAADRNAIRRKSRGWFTVTGIVCSLWVVCIPLYKPFMRYCLGYADTGKLFRLVMILLVPYIFYAFQNVFDSVFYGTGRTDYMLCEAVITNAVYYGIAFILYRAGIWTPSLTGIALLFGFGNIFDSVVSLALYKRFLRRLS